MRSHIIISSLLFSGAAFGFESTKVLPKGVRNLDIRSVYTQTSVKTDPEGNEISLANDLYKPLKFKNVLQGEEGLKRTQLKAFMLARGFEDEDTVGEFRASLNAQINVLAPILAWGLTESTTLAVAVPYYSTSTDINVGFRTNEGGEELIKAFTEPSVNYYYAAVEAAQKFQNAVGRLNERLEANSYEELSAWNQTGWGDTTIALKNLALKEPRFRIASTAGFVAPTGRKDNPSILTDLPFGDAQWDVFGQLTFDQYITGNIFINEYAKYTYQAADRKSVRWKTGEETVMAVPHDTTFKLGDKIDAGLSVQFEQDSGIVGGLGAVYYRKYSDRWEVNDPEVKRELQRDTAQDAVYWEAKLGYSTVAAYQRKEFALPLSVSAEYKKQYQSRNHPITDFAQFDLNLFF